jgi:hypothetical protein
LGVLGLSENGVDPARDDVLYSYGKPPFGAYVFFGVRLKLDVFKIAKIYQKVYSMLRKKHSKIIGSVLGKTYRF